jgi:hypothetical protein
MSLDAERHACELAANSIRWLLVPGRLEHAHPGTAAHLKLARTGLVSAMVHLEAVRGLLQEEET